MRNPLYILLPAARWDAQYAKGSWKKVLHNNALNTQIIAEMCAKKGAGERVRILDAGCGSGALLDELRKSGIVYTYVGFDFSAEAISQIRDIDVSHESVLVADVRVPPKLEGMFDVIVFNEVLYYVSPWRTVSNYKKLLAPQGILVVSIYNTWRRTIIFLLLALPISFTDSRFIQDSKGKRSWVIKSGMFRFPGI